MKRRILTSMALLVAAFASANGYKILCVRSAKATAMGEAFIAQADDPSAVAFNPAGLADLKGVHLSLQSTWCNAFTSREAPDGSSTTHMEDQWQAVPSFFATWDMGTERFTLGAGASLPNGLSSRWDDRSFATWTGYYSSLIIADYTLALGYRISDHLSVGAGLDYYSSELDQRQRYPVPGTPIAYLYGTGETWGFNLGARYEINERHSVAATYRHPFTVDYEGDLTVQGLGAFPMETGIDYPGSVVLGYAFRPTQKWTFEVDLDWTHWSQVGDVIVDVPAPIGQIRLPRDYENTFAYKFGVQYQYSEALALRAGYIYNENATAEATWSPTQPDTDMHFFTCGFAYAVNEYVTLESALQVVYYETRTIDNTSSIDGTYRTWAPCFTLGVTCHF